MEDSMDRLIFGIAQKKPMLTPQDALCRADDDYRNEFLTNKDERIQMHGIMVSYPQGKNEDGKKKKIVYKPTHPFIPS